MKKIILTILILFAMCSQCFAGFEDFWNFSGLYCGFGGCDQVIVIPGPPGSDGYEVAGGAYYLLSDGSYYINAP